MLCGKKNYVAFGIAGEISVLPGHLCCFSVSQGLTLDSGNCSCAKQPSLARSFIGLVTNVFSMSTVSAAADTLQFVTSVQFGTVYTQFYIQHFPKAFNRFSMSDTWLKVYILLRFPYTVCH